jgi:ketosteroid isomerase-like protein
MTRPLTIALLFTSLIWDVGSTQAHRKPLGSLPRNAAATIEAIERRWAHALATRDTAALRAILAETYISTDENGNRSDRSTMLNALASGDLRIDSISLGDMHVSAYRDAAVATGTATQAATYKGQPLSRAVAFTDTFILQQGRWRAVASHHSGIH